MSRWQDSCQGKYWRSERVPGTKRHLRNARKGLHFQCRRAEAEIDKALAQMDDMSRHRERRAQWPQSKVDALKAKYEEGKTRLGRAVFKWEQLDTHHMLHDDKDNSIPRHLTWREQELNLEIRKEKIRKEEIQWWEVGVGGGEWLGRRN